MTESQNRIAIAGLAFALLFLPTTADATEFHCGDAFITFPVKGDGSNPARIFTIPKEKIGGIIVTDKLSEFRKQYPQYDDLDDGALATALQDKYYSDMSDEHYLEMISARVAYVRVGASELPVTPATRLRIVNCLD